MGADTPPGGRSLGEGPTPISLRPPMTLAPAPPGPVLERRFSWWKETGMDGRTVRYLVRDQDGNHVATCGLESKAQDLVDLLNFALRAEAGIDALDAPLTALRDHLGCVPATRAAKGPVSSCHANLDAAWQAIGRIRGAP